jgi:hypothetical protein
MKNCRKKLLSTLPYKNIPKTLYPLYKETGKNKEET